MLWVLGRVQTLVTFSHPWTNKQLWLLGRAQTLMTFSHPWTYKTLWVFGRVQTLVTFSHPWTNKTLCVLGGAQTLITSWGQGGIKKWWTLGRAPTDITYGRDTSSGRWASRHDFGINSGRFWNHFETFRDPFNTLWESFLDHFGIFGFVVTYYWNHFWNHLEICWNKEVYKHIGGWSCSFGVSGTSYQTWSVLVHFGPFRAMGGALERASAGNWTSPWLQTLGHGTCLNFNIEASLRYCIYILNIEHEKIQNWILLSISISEYGGSKLKHFKI